MIALAAQNRDIGVKAALERDVRLVRYEDGRLEIALEPSAPKTLVHDLSRKFSQWTNRRWMVIVSGEAGEPTVKSRNDARQAELKTGVQADPAGGGRDGAFSGCGNRRCPQARCRAAAVAAGRDDVPDFPADDLPDERDEEF